MTPTRREFLESGAILGSSLLCSSRVNAANTPPSPVRIGLYGTTHSHASGKAAAIRKNKELFDVVGVVEPNEHAAKAVADHKAYEGLPVLTEAQLLNTPGLEAVLIETAPRELIAPAIRFAEAGLHIHLEKPGASSMPMFEKLLGELKRRNRILQMGYMFRRNPAFEFCFKAAREGLLGDIYEINAVMGKLSGAAERKGMAEFPGGTMFELGCHLLDAMVTLLGKPQQVHSFLRKTRPDVDDLADNALAVCEYPKALVTIRSDANDVEGTSRRSFTICGDKGTASILPLETPQLKLTLLKASGGFNAGAQEIRLKKMPGRFDDQLADFARIIRGEKELDYTPDHDRTVMETVLRASGMQV